MPELEDVEADVDPVVVLMDLARHLIHRENDARGRAKLAASTSDQGMVDVENATAASYDDAAGHVRELARYLDGDVDEVPVAVATGEMHRSDPDEPVPWRADDA